MPILPIYSSFDFVVVLEFDDENSEHLDFVAPESDSAKNMYLDLSAAQSDEDNQDSEFVITESNDENNQDLPTAPKLDAEVDTENNDLDNAAPESNENKNFEFSAPESEGEENNVNFVTRDADEDNFEAPKLTDKSNTDFDFVAAQSGMTLHENNNDIDFAVSESDEYNHDLKSDYNAEEGKNMLYDVPAKNGMIFGYSIIHFQHFLSFNYTKINEVHFFRVHHFCSISTILCIIVYVTSVETCIFHLFYIF